MQATQNVISSSWWIIYLYPTIYQDTSAKLSRIMSKPSTYNKPLPKGKNGRSWC